MNELDELAAATQQAWAGHERDVSVNGMCPRPPSPATLARAQPADRTPFAGCRAPHLLRICAGFTDETHGRKRKRIYDARTRYADAHQRARHRESQGQAALRRI
jgi:hypothetical protein